MTCDTITRWINGVKVVLFYPAELDSVAPAVPANHPPVPAGDDAVECRLPAWVSWFPWNFLHAEGV